jgi:crossover junction endodeoxyribonuclease RusA
MGEVSGGDGMKSNSVTLPWPSKELSPNARMHWAQKAKFAKAYRMACFTLCLQVKLIKPDTEGRLHLWIDFYPPDRRNRDDDNMIASFKSGRDGIADALEIDDKRFVCHPFVSDQIGGMVKVRVTAGPTP